MKYNVDPEREIVTFERSDDDLFDYLSQRGYQFPPEIVTRYYLALKTKPFVILSGVSGTGKTKLAQLFADYMCADANPNTGIARSAFVPVRPDWTDNRGLIGFYNLLDEHYHGTPFLELLLDASESPGIPFFVILDEMNLAKVEHYFSDFLSLMESRVSTEHGGEPLRLHEQSDAQLPSGRTVPREIKIPANVFFTGTVNVDESTYMFSPKVLDRANVIEFSDIELFGSQFGASNFVCLNSGAVREKLVDDIGTGLVHYHRIKKRLPESVELLTELYVTLREFNMHFGYRVVNEIARFLELAVDEVSDFDLAAGMDIQVLQKILPKFHGTQARLDRPVAALSAIAERRKYVRSAAKLDRMQHYLVEQGYTSFIEA